MINNGLPPENGRDFCVDIVKGILFNSALAAVQGLNIRKYVLITTIGNLAVNILFHLVTRNQPERTVRAKGDIALAIKIPAAIIEIVAMNRLDVIAELGTRWLIALKCVEILYSDSQIDRYVDRQRQQ